MLQVGGYTPVLKEHCRIVGVVVGVLAAGDWGSGVSGDVVELMTLIGVRCLRRMLHLWVYMYLQLPWLQWRRHKISLITDGRKIFGGLNQLITTRTPRPRAPRLRRVR